MTLKYLTSAVFTALVFLSANAQPMGTVGTKPVNQQLITNITTVYPHLNNTADTAIIRSYLSKYYATQMVIADSVKKMPAYDSLKPVIEDLRNMIEAKVLAIYFQDKVVEKAIIPTEKEIKDYYETNKGNYKTVPVYSFFQAYTQSNDKAVIADIKKLMLEMYKQPEAKYGLSKKTGADYTVNFETKLMMQPSYTLYEPLKNSKVGAVSGPYDLKGRNDKLYLLVTYAEPEKTKPLSEVREDCINAVKIQKTEAINKSIGEKATKQYPIKFN